jgi:hypothetical protein
MSEKSKPRKSKYKYKYVQFTVSSSEKKQIEAFINKENFKTISEFVRRTVFDYIRKQENPELFLSYEHNSINLLLIENVKNIREILKNQELILQREDSLEEMREMVACLHKIAERNALAKEREVIIQLLENHNSLSLRQIQEETKIPEDVVFKIISDMNIFKITSTGRFTLR